VVGQHILKQQLIVQLASSGMQETYDLDKVEVATAQVAALARSRNAEGITPATQPRRHEPRERGERRKLRDEIESYDQLDGLVLDDDFLPPEPATPLPPTPSSRPAPQPRSAQASRLAPPQPPRPVPPQRPPAPQAAAPELPPDPEGDEDEPTSEGAQSQPGSQQRRRRRRGGRGNRG
jgi:hypothetical protein